MKNPAPTRSVIFIILLISTTLYGHAHAAERSKKELSSATKIKLDVSGPASERLRLLTCLKKEFGAYQNIRVVEEAPQWELSIIVVQTPMRGGGYTDFAISLAVFNRWAQAANQFQGHQLLVGIPDLQTGCRKIAQHFLKDYLHIGSKKNPRLGY